MNPRATPTRRAFLKEMLLLGSAAAAVRAAERTTTSPLPPGQLPAIQLGSLRVSRLILGSNPFFGFNHGNPQASAEEMKAFYTDDRIMAVLDAAADQGISAVWTPCYDQWIRVWNRYREKGGKLKIWIGQPDPGPDQMENHLRLAIENGAQAICIQGIRVDEQMEAGRLDTLRRWLDLIRNAGLPAGLATHKARTHLIAEEKGLPTDFYHQTLYRPDRYVRQGLKESLAVIDQLDKPVVAYKALGAGRLDPQKALPPLLKRLKAKDGLCLGMFPKRKDEIAENAALIRAS